MLIDPSSNLSTIKTPYLLPKTLRKEKISIQEVSGKKCLDRLKNEVFIDTEHECLNHLLEEGHAEKDFPENIASNNNSDGVESVTHQTDKDKSEVSRNTSDHMQRNHLNKMG